jgi:hypothetical protein
MSGKTVSARTIGICMILLLAWGCNLPGSEASATGTSSPALIFPPLDDPTPTSTPAAATITETVTVIPSVPTFKAAVIVDTTSELVTREQAHSLVSDANAIFLALTGFGFEMVDFVEDGAGGSTTDMANRYIQSYASVFPNGVIIFSYGDNEDARLLGGYGYAIPGAAGFHNTFVSPVTGDGQVYVAVVHFSHKYAACGYGGLETVQGSASFDGECRNQPGIACVEHNGYSMCSNAVDNLYASTPTHFVASTIIHEVLHPFSPGGNQDHYATPQCNAVMGWPENHFDLAEAEYYNGMCPFVYQNFIQSYQP